MVSIIDNTVTTKAILLILLPDIVKALEHGASATTVSPAMILTASATITRKNRITAMTVRRAGSTASAAVSLRALGQQTQTTMSPGHDGTIKLSSAHPSYLLAALGDSIYSPT